METSKKFLHDRVILLLVTALAVLLVIGVSIVLLRFDPSKNPTTTVAYRQNITGTYYQSGKPIDIYSLALFMLVSTGASILISSRVYAVRRSISLFVLSSEVFLMLLVIRVAWSLISLQ